MAWIYEKDLNPAGREGKHSPKGGNPTVNEGDQSPQGGDPTGVEGEYSPKAETQPLRANHSSPNGHGERTNGPRSGNS